jgi:hypothetical protein
LLSVARADHNAGNAFFELIKDPKQSDQKYLAFLETAQAVEKDVRNETVASLQS